MLLELVAGVAIGYSGCATAAWVIASRGKRMAEERLYAAWRDGAVIPPVETEPTEPEHVDSAFDGLPSAVLEWVKAQEGVEAQERWARRGHALMAKHKNNIPAVISELDEPSW